MTMQISSSSDGVAEEKKVKAAMPGQEAVKAEPEENKDFVKVGQAFGPDRARIPVRHHPLAPVMMKLMRETAGV